MKLRYKGNGDYIPIVPARDLDEEDIEAISRIYGLTIDETINSLIARGLYTRVKPKSEPKTQPSQDTEVQGE